MTLCPGQSNMKSSLHPKQETKGSGRKGFVWEFCPITTTAQRWRPRVHEPPFEQLGNPGNGGGKCCDVKSGRNEEQHLFSRSNVKFMKVTPEMKFPTDTV